MSLPQTCQSPSTSFQASLFESGFTHWWLFPASDFPHKSGFYAALATALLCHTWPNYEEFSRQQREGSWHQGVATLQAIDENYGLGYGEDKFQQIGYWKELGDECASLCADVFAAQQKREAQAMIMQKQVKETADSAFYEHIAKRFSSYLCIYEMTETGPKMKEFHSDHPGEFATFVTIAFENDSVLVLSHKDFEWDTLREQKFPNYKRIRYPGAEPVNLISPNPIPRSTDHQLPTIISAMTKLINLLGRFAVDHQINPSETNQKETQQGIRQALLDVRELSKGREDLDLCFEDAENVLSLQIQPLPPAKPRNPHTILNCEDYLDEGPAEIHHTHRFHTHCLYDYLNTITGDLSRGLKCPFSSCPTPLAEEVLEEFPDLMKKFGDWKALNLASRSDEGIASDTQPCHICGLGDVGAVFSCGCRLCRRCSSKAYWDGVCVKCSTTVTVQDKAVVDVLFERFPMS